MAKVSVYLNKHASNSSKIDWESEFKKSMFRHEIEFKKPENLELLKESLRREKALGTEYIFSVGGDGTANTITQEIAGTGIKLFVIPAGTANDFATQLGITNNIAKIAQIFQHKTTRKVDLIDINGKLMFSNGGIGIAHTVAVKVNEYRNKIKGFKQIMKFIGADIYSYVLAKEMTINAIDYRNIHIECDDFPRLDKIVSTPLLLINNQARIGSKFVVAPETVNNDGKFNVTIFTHKNKMDFIKCILSISKGKLPKNDPNLISFETNRITLNSLDTRGLDFFGDGEILAQDQILNIGIKKEELEVCSFDKNTVYCSSYTLDNIMTL